MIIRAIAETLENAPDDLSWGVTKESKVSITKGKEYVVHALSVFKGVTFFEILDDLRGISWLPYRFFTVVDRSIPDDWECNVLQGEVKLILGPSFVAESEDAYSRMVEGDSEQGENFWRRAIAKGLG
ncbi:MAG: hypothetical protein PHV74_14245 [Dehalococcoidia bacterium]|nr:hypothetical protein [Dehalococcoidia bacterium]